MHSPAKCLIIDILKWCFQTYFNSLRKIMQSEIKTFQNLSAFIKAVKVINVTVVKKLCYFYS